MKNIYKLLFVGAGIYILYKISQKKSVVTEVPIKNIVGGGDNRHSVSEIDLEHITQEEIATTNIHIGPVIPQFGKPELVEEHFKNYVDVKKNEYFKPQISPFFK